MLRQNLASFLVVLLFVALLFLGQGANIYTDWLWYREIGEESFFARYLLYQWGMAAGGFFGVFLLIGGNLWLARRLAPPRVRVIDAGVLELPLLAMSPVVTPVLWGIAGFLAILAGSAGFFNWQLPMLFVHGIPFGIPDPIFSRDAGFYVFRLPFLAFLYQWSLVALVASLGVVSVVYVLARGIRATLEGVRVSPKVLVHLSALLSLLLLVRGGGYLLRMYESLSTSHGVIWGPAYTDLHARIPFQKLLFVVAMLGGVVTFLNIAIRSWKVPLWVFSIWGMVSLAGVMYPQFVQQFKVVPNELALEEPFIKHHIDMTRKAYQLDRVAVKQFLPQQSLTPDSLTSEAWILKNIRLWDSAPLLTTYAQLQEFRPYYKFLDTDIDRYTIGGELRQVILSARELSHDHLQSRSWVNEHLVYTHGYGAIVSAVNQVSPEGLPQFLIKDIPPSSPGALSISRPEIYFGEIANTYTLVNTRQQEFDYPSGEENRYAHYKGKGGVPTGSFWRRLLFAVRFSTLKLLLSNDFTPESRVMYVRALRERLAKAFPLLAYDRDPYLVVLDGKLVWIADAYTVTRHFPYSAPFEGRGNYLRNAVKAVVDAYDGTVTFYVSDPTDPLIRTYMKLFPGLFHELGEMPADLKAHLRYPEDFFRVQAEMYALFHMGDPRVFYNKEDVWHFPRMAEGRSVAMEPYYTVMKFPGAEKEEFLQMMPFTPAKKDNLSAWMAARSDPPHYGELLVYLFPKQELVFGPMQVVARINQDPVISQLMTLWGQQGSSIIRGQLQVIPIGSSILYVQSLYLRSERGQLPELKRVVAAYGNTIAMEETLPAALARVLGAPAGGALTGTAPGGELRRPPADGVLDDRLREARAHYREAVKHQRAGDWARYGEELKRLEEVLGVQGNGRKKRE